MSNKNGEKSFWSTVPGILTGIAAIITAIGGIIIVLNTASIIGPDGQTPTPMQTPTPTLTPTPSEKVIHADYEGDTYAIHNIRLIQLEAKSVNEPPRVNDRITIEFKLRNIGDNPIRFNNTFVAARNPLGKNEDFGHSNQGTTIPPQEIVETKASINVDKKGTWRFWPCYTLDIPETTEEYKLCQSEWKRFQVLVEQ